MYNKFLFIILFISISFVSFWGCGGCGTENNDEKNDTLNVIDTKDPTLVKFNGRLFSVPSPFQVAMLVKDANVPYNKDLLNPTNNQSNYTTNFKQALNLGVYGANLGYLNIYDQLPDAASYFAVVKILSKELGIMNSFNEVTLKRIEANNNNRDSLIYIISTIYRDADAYLMNNQRNDISVLILAGGWIESLYLITQSLKQTKNQALVDRIGEQKHPLDNLIELLRPYYGKESDEFDQFLEQLVDLATVFDGVVIEYVYEPPTIDVANKTTTINSKSKTIITDYQLKTITETVANLRKKIIE